MKTSTLLGLFISIFSFSAQADFLVGWIGPLTGNAAVLGVDSVPAIQIAIDQINKNGGIGGETVKLLIEDDQYQASKTISAYHSLVHARGVKALFILTYGGLFALADRAENDGVLIIDTLDCDEKIAALNRNIFCIAKTTESLGINLAEQILSKKSLPTALIYFDGDPFMGTLAQSFLARLNKEGQTPKVIETYNDATTDFQS